MEKTPLTNKDFIEWFAKHEVAKTYTAINFIKFPFILQIGIWLEYLEHKNLIVLGYVGSYSIIYKEYNKFIVDDKDVEHFENDGDGSVYFRNNRPTGYLSRIDSFRLGIIEGLKHIESQLQPT